MTVSFELIKHSGNDPFEPESTEACFTSSQRKNWLEQYYQIRQECFRRDLGIKSFDGAEDKFDRSGYLLIALDRQQCIGGVRLSISTPESPLLLPLEINGFMLQERFPDIARNKESYSQWTRLALKLEYRASEVLHRMALVMIQQTKRLQCSYSFNVAGMNRARLYQRLHRLQGFNYEILKGVNIPAEGNLVGLEHLLSVGYLKPKPIEQMLSRQLLAAPARNANPFAVGVACQAEQSMRGVGFKHAGMGV